jgi:hypothetical protein
MYFFDKEINTALFSGIFSGQPAQPNGFWGPFVSYESPPLTSDGHSASKHSPRGVVGVLWAYFEYMEDSILAKVQL